MPIYTTLFNQQFGATNEPINASFEYGQDFTSDGFNDIKVTLSLNGAANSGTEDLLGVAFDLALTTGLQIVNIVRSEQSNTQTLSTFNPTVVIGANQVSDDGPLDPGFNTTGDGSAEPYDVGIKFSEPGSGEGIVQTASFVMRKPGENLDKSLIENTNWWVRLQSTDGGGGSAKTGGFIGTIPDSGPPPNPSIFIDKLTNGADGINLLIGQPIAWTYKVSNTGNVALSGISLTDDKEGTITNFSGDTDSDGLLDTNEVWTYTKTGTAKAGSYSNTGNVTGSYNGTPVTDSDPSSYFGAAPAFTIEKLTNGYDGKDILTGQPITWTYKVTNTGNIDLTNLEVKDDNGTPGNTSDDFVVGSIASLPVGSNQTLQKASTAITGAYANVGTASNTYTDGAGNNTPISVTDPSNYFGANPALKVNKLTNGFDGKEILAGKPITWTYEVTNTGNVNLTNVQVKDDNGTPANTSDDFVVGTIASLPAGQSTTVQKASTAITGAYANIGTASNTYTDGLGNSKNLSATDPSNYFGANPALTINKLTNGFDGKQILAGQPITWTYEVKNTGNVNLTNVQIKDDNGTPGNTSDDFVVGTIASLATGQSTTLQKTSTAITGAYTNIGKASNTYTDGVGNSTNLSATDPSNYFGAKPALTINKLTNGFDGKAILAGLPITWTYEVKNTGNVNLTNVQVNDDNGTPANPNDDFVVGTIASLATGQSTTLQKTSTAITGAYTNIGKASNTYTDGVGNSTNVSATDPSNYFGAKPSIKIDKVTKSTPVQGDGLLIPQGSAISWIYTVTNTGNVPLSNVQVTDNKGVVPVYKSGDANQDGKLDLTESWVYSANGTAISGSYQNIGTAKGSYTDGLNNPATPTSSDPSSYTGVRPPGARTPGFWQAHFEVWDGVASNDSSFAGRSNFPASDILRPPYSAATVDPVTGQTTVGILVGDYNRNGKTDAGENTVFYTLQEAQTIVNASQTAPQDTRATLARSLDASWLNYLAVNPAPTGDMSQAIAWLQKYTPDENGDGKGDGNLSLQASTYAIPASSPAWSNGTNTYNGLPTGEVLKNKLDSYNNTGLFGTQPV
jgi:uncharacterized repeat protein (TIGR01451 family)